MIPPRLLPTLLAALTLLVATASAQQLPNHVDPSARDFAPNLAAVPAIRFLTTADFPPFNYRDKNGELVGYNVDLARGICSTLNIACTLQAWPWDQASNALADNQGDALIAGLAITPQNGERFDFSTLYLELPGRFVTVLDNRNDFDPLALGTRPVAVRRGTAHEEFLRRYLPDVPRITYASENEALEAVKAGTAFAYFGDAMRASFWLNDNLDCCGFAGDAYFRPDLFGEGMAVAVAGGHDAVRRAIDWALIRMQRDGTLDDLYLRWFPVSFY